MTTTLRVGELKKQYEYLPFRATIAMIEDCPKVIILHCKTDQGEVIEVSTFDVNGTRKYFTHDIIEGYLPSYQRNMKVRRFHIDGYAVDQNPQCYIRVAVPHVKDELLETKKHLIEMIKSYDNLEALYEFKDRILQEKSKQPDNFQHITLADQENEYRESHFNPTREAEEYENAEVWGD